MELASVSGAKDCGSFLAAKSHRVYPSPSSITYEGTFYQHYFDVTPTKDKAVHVELSTATTKDPLFGAVDYFMCMGMSSKYDGAGLRQLGGRPPVALVFVLDISGSMGSKFYTQNAKQLRSGSSGSGGSGGAADKSKLEAAVEALIGLLDNLKDGDWFGVVLFDTRAEVGCCVHVVICVCV